MSKIKTKKVIKGTIKAIDKSIVALEKTKDAVVDIKEKSENAYYSNGNVNEYSSQKVKNSSSKGINENIYKFNNKGKKSVIETKNNLIKSKENLKQIKNKIIKIRDNKKLKKTKSGIKNNNKKIKKSLKTIRMKNKLTKETLKKTMIGIKKVVKITISTVKAIITGTKALISALIAGGWIALIIIIIISLIAILCNSYFGIFFSGEKTDKNDISMSDVVKELNTELMDKISFIQKENTYDDYVINYNRADWKEILAVYTVIITKGKNEADVITLDDSKKFILKDIFWKMNVITYSIEEETREPNKKRILNININGKNSGEMIQEYNLSDLQQEQLKVLLSDKYNNLWIGVIYGNGAENSDVVEIALSQIGNVGGQIYWKWYGFDSRVEWCAIFVSWVFNEAGYLNEAIPKFSTCHTQGIPWFKTMGLWKEKGYIPSSGNVIFFDWEQDEKADHVGIVEKVSNGYIYTIEGNSRDEVKQKSYPLDSKYIYGYGIPKY